MSGPNGVIQTVAFAQLDTAVTLANVYQDAPEDTPPPVVILGDISAEPFTNDPNDPDRRVTLTVTTIVAGDEVGPCTDIQDQVETLGGYRVTTDGWELLFRSLGSDATLVGDASGYVGTTTFEIIAFKQD